MKRMIKWLKVFIVLGLVITALGFAFNARADEGCEGETVPLPFAIEQMKEFGGKVIFQASGVDAAEALFKISEVMGNQSPPLKITHTITIWGFTEPREEMALIAITDSTSPLLCIEGALTLPRMIVDFALDLKEA